MRAILIVVGSTYRLEIAAGGERLAAARRAGRPVILTFWHNRSFIAADFFRKQIFRRGFDVLVMASLSRDGELVSRVARGWDLSLVRGSASRGGLGAVRAIYRAMKRQGSSPVIIPDGPRGPLYDFKIGVVILAQTSRAPILPLGMAARRYFTVRSWDRLIVPWPFSRIAAVVGEEQPVPRGLSPEDLEAERLRLQELLNGLTRQAEDTLYRVTRRRPRP